MSKYTRYYNNRKNFYKTFAAAWASWAEGADLTTIELEGMAKFFKPIAVRFGLVEYFAKLGII